MKHRAIVLESAFLPSFYWKTCLEKKIIRLGSEFLAGAFFSRKASSDFRDDVVGCERTSANRMGLMTRIAQSV